MIPNLGHQRILGGQKAGVKLVDTNPGNVVYEESIVDMYNFNLPCGPSQFMVEVGSSDTFKKDAKEKEYRIHYTDQAGIVLDITIPFTHVYFFSKHRQTIRRAVSQGYQPKLAT